MNCDTDRDEALLALIREADRLRALRITFQGRLVSMTKADELHVEVLAGALLCAVEADYGTQEGWRQKGAEFFRKREAGRSIVPASGSRS